MKENYGHASNSVPTPDTIEHQRNAAREVADQFQMERERLESLIEQHQRDLRRIEDAMAAPLGSHASPRIKAATERAY